jgi:ABC-type sugar transport system ATPase subunit
MEMQMNENEPSVRLSAKGVSKTYGAVRALDSVDFELRKGEVMALLGENGAGKSTIVKVLSGLIAPDAGTITIDGEESDISTSFKAQAAGIAVVQQEYSSVGTMSVAENLVLGKRSSPWVWRKKRLNDEAREQLKIVGLGDLDPNRLVESLSVAEMQLLEIARVLSRDARIVIFDEPTAALSDAEITRVLDAVRQLASRGISVIYVTHRLPEVFEISDRITIFRNGRSYPPVETGTVDVDQVITMMLGRELDAMYPSKATTFGESRLSLDALEVPGIRDAVTLDVKRGEILGLTGQLGSGVGTLMKALAGETAVFSGTMSLDGKTVDLRSRRAGIQAGIAYCSADRKKDGIFGELTIQRNLSSPWLSSVARFGIVSPARERQRAADIAGQFAIDISRLRSNVGILSGGNQQKVAFGKWLGIAPLVLLVEEPTRGVDVGARTEIYRNLRELCDSGMTIIVSSSDTSEIFGLADTIATFYHGEMTALKPSAEWTEASVVREVMNRSEAA